MAVPRSIGAGRAERPASQLRSCTRCPAGTVIFRMPKRQTNGKRPPVARLGRRACASRRISLVPLVLATRSVGALFGIAATFGVPSTSDAQGMATGTRTGPGPDFQFDGELPEIRYEDIGSAAGLSFRHVAADPDRKEYIIETTGSGVALLDYDQDGLLDIFLVNGSSWNEGPADGLDSNRLFRNLGGLRFADMTEAAALTRGGWGQGACVGDYDNDGRPDLFVTFYGSDVLYRNLGDGSFADVSEVAGIPRDDRRWSTGCAFLDYDRDGLLDLAVASYIDFDRATVPKPGENELCAHLGHPVVCGPRGLPGGVNALYRQVSPGRFADVSSRSGFQEPRGYYCFSVLTGDFNGDGWTDVYIACDSTPSILFRNNGDGTFVDEGLLSGTALNADGREQGGMGAAAGDFDGDGLMDIAKTNFADDIPSLYRNLGGGLFADVTIRAGLGVNTHFVGWGVAFLDVDHDGRQDLFMANGHVYPEADRIGGKATFRQAKNVYWNTGQGGFVDVSARAGPGANALHSARGAAFGDLDNDGDIEIVVNNLDAAPSLLVNRAEKAHWLQVRLRAADSNRDGFGAVVLLRAGALRATREARSGGSYLSSNDPRLYFGLGDNERVDEIEVRWPTGLTEAYGAAPADREITLVEGQGSPLADDGR